MRKRLLLTLIIPAAVFLLSGCAVNLKNDPLYKVYLRKELTLAHSARIIERKYASQTIWGPGGELKTGELYQLVDLKDEEFERLRTLYESWDLETRSIYGQEYELSEGTPLKLKKIYSFMDGSGGVDIRAQGLIYFKDRGAYVPFEFLWSKQGPAGGHQFLPRKLKIAPWERDVEDDRTVKFDGQSR